MGKVPRRLTPRSSRTPPALPFALSQLFAISAPLIASVQAWPLSFIVRPPKMTLPISFFHGIVIRKKSLLAHGIQMAELLNLFETDRSLGEDSDLVSFGPSFGPEACNTFIRRLEALGLVYTDDFFDLALDHPNWLTFSASHS